jgi:subtilisin family serine protease
VTSPQWTVVPAAVGAPPIVAIVDSGLRLPGGGLHEDLDPVRVVPVANSQPPLPPAFYLDNVDREGHGTLIAGTVAAITNNGLGIASPVHPGWNIHLMAVKFFEPPGRPTVAAAIIGIAWAAGRFCIPFVSNRVKVINVSWHVPAGGGNLFGVFGLRWVLRRAASDMVRCVVVFAAGNDGTDNQIYPLFPANFSTDAQLQGRVMTALATDHYDNKAFFSNYSPLGVDIGAPGIHVLSTGRYLVPPPGRYARYSGTSAAAAYVSAGAGLVAALNPGWGPVEIVRHLLAAADRIPQLRIACVDGKRLNLANAVYAPVTPLAPVAGAVLPRGVPFNITWAQAFNNAAFAQVDVDFVDEAGNVIAVIGNALVAAGVIAWVPNAPPLPPGPVRGAIRITATGSNIRLYSGTIQV